MMAAVESPLQYNFLEPQTACLWEEDDVTDDVIFTGRDEFLSDHVVNEPDLEEELCELQSAYQAMCEQAAPHHAALPLLPPPPPPPPPPPRVPAAAAEPGLAEHYLAAAYPRHPDLEPAAVPCSRMSAAASSQWVEQHYRAEAGVSVPRRAMYGHYVTHCRACRLEPVNQASFGKLIRTVFPAVRTRRLGTRGHSRYHYYGLSIKESSPYKDVIDAFQHHSEFLSPEFRPEFTLNLSAGGDEDGSQGPKSLLGPDTPLQECLLPADFPSPDHISCLPTLRDKMTKFLTLYREHASKVLGAILQANLTQVRDAMSEFWGQLPNSLRSVLYHSYTMHLVALCEAALYRAMSHLLFPAVTKPLPASLVSAIRSFATELQVWQEDALADQPLILRQHLLQLCRGFCRGLRRQTGLCHMAEVARCFLHNGQDLEELQRDWQRLDLQGLLRLCCLPRLEGGTGGRYREAVHKALKEFQHLLHQGSNLSEYLSWLSSLLDACVFKPAQAKPAPTLATPSKAPTQAPSIEAEPTEPVPTLASPQGSSQAPSKAVPNQAATQAGPSQTTPIQAASVPAASTQAAPSKSTPTQAAPTQVAPTLSLQARAARFLLEWTYNLQLLTKELTLANATRFGSYHLLSLLFTDYIMHQVDVRCTEAQEQHLHHAVCKGLCSRTSSGVDSLARSSEHLADTCLICQHSISH